MMGALFVGYAYGLKFMLVALLMAAAWGLSVRFGYIAINWTKNRTRESAGAEREE